MDFATLSGLIAGIIVVAAALSTGSDLMIFLNLPSALLVVGGTAAAVFIKFPLKACVVSFAVGLRTAFINTRERPQELIAIAVELAHIMRKRGKLAFDNADINNPFFKKGAQFIADDYKPDLIRKAMTLEMYHSIDRQEMSERVYRAIGESAPAFGMIGTLVGLVQMLVELDDPSKIGMGMAVALLTTLYGALIANLLALPIAEKLAMRSQYVRNNQELIIEAILQIQQQQNPRVLEELLYGYVASGKKDGVLPVANNRQPVGRDK